LKGKNMANVAVFLDRDDTIIEDPGYINDPAQVKLLRGVAESLRRLQKMGYKLVVVTNQSAVARGIISEEVLEEIHERLQNLLIRRRVHLDAIYYCPYHPEGVIAKYRRESDLRKPGSGMLLQAAEDLDIDLEQSWMIGNSYSDITAGANAGCKTILISSSAKLPERKRGDARPDARPDKTAANLTEAVNIIKMFQRENMAAARRTETTVSAAEAEAAEAEATETVETSETPAEDAAEEEAAETVQPEAPAEEQDVEEPQPQPPEAQPDEAASRAVVEPAGTGSRPMKPESTADTGADEPAAPTASDSTEIRRVLEDVMRHLRKVDRMNMYDEFSLMKLLAGVIQVVVIFLLLLSIWFLMDPTRTTTAVHTVLGYAAVLQLMVIAFHMMRDRK